MNANLFTRDLVLFLFSLVLASTTLAQKPKVIKGWRIETRSTWVASTNGCLPIHVKISTANGKPAKDDATFYLVATQHHYNQPHAVFNKTLTLNAGDAAAETDFLVNLEGNEYTGYLYFHIERDGNRRFDIDDVMREYINVQPAASTYSPPTMLVVTPNVVNAVNVNLRTPKGSSQLRGVPFNLDEKNFPSVALLQPFYPDNNGGFTAKSNPSASDLFESPCWHAANLAELPTSWLGYTSAESVLISLNELGKLATKPAKINALRRWAAAGGALIVYDCGKDFQDAEKARRIFDDRQASAAWIVPTIKKGQKLIVRGQSNYYYQQDFDTKFSTASEMSKARDRKEWALVGPSDDLALTVKQGNGDFACFDYNLGRVFIVADKMDKWKLQQWRALLNAVSVAGPSITERLGEQSTGTPDDEFCIADVGRPPVIEFQFLIGFFVLLIGPVSYYFLRKRRQLQLMYLTVPLISAMACVGLLLYAVLSDGFENQGRLRAFTSIDHKRGRAVSFVRHSHYCGMQPSNYRFGRDEFVVNSRADQGPSSIYSQSTDEIQLNGGDIRPRMPHQILQVKSFETDRGLFLSSTPNETELPFVENRFESNVVLAIFKGKYGYYFVKDLKAGTRVESNRLLTDDENPARAANARQGSEYKEMLKLIRELSPKVSDDFFKSSLYENRLNYGWSNANPIGEFELKRQLGNLRNAKDYLKSPGDYIAILQDYSELKPPQEAIDYKDKLYVVHGQR